MRGLLPADGNAQVAQLGQEPEGRRANERQRVNEHTTECCYGAPLVGEINAEHYTGITFLR